MPRQSRASIHVPGALVHVICRFVDYRFVLDDEGRRHYLGLLSQALRRTDWVLVSYALMSSHIHLALVMGDDELSGWIHRLNLRFAQWVNRRLGLAKERVLGHVFADRPTTRVMCPSRARPLITYHHRNPLEAGVVDNARDSDWTSHRSYLGLSRAIDGLHTLLGLELAGFDPTLAGRTAFDAFVARTAISAQDLKDSAPVLAAPRGSSSSVSRAHDVVRLACAELGQPVVEVMGASRRRPLVMARRAAVVAWLEVGGSAAEMARALGISPAAVSRLLSRPHDADAVRRSVDRVLIRLGGTD